METKKDIYNLWVQYTTKNEEDYFRQFVGGFVAIWKGQLQIDFGNAPSWNEIKVDNGPHLSRLPDELLPAIGKFIIIARDEAERTDLQNLKLDEISMLIECLIIICRHFDNISTVVKYDYIANLIAILSKVFHKITSNDTATIEQIRLFSNFCNLLEVIYDPYLTWRSYLRGIFAEYNKLNYKPNPVHVEIVPFIYDCFQTEKIFDIGSIGTSLVNALGSVIAGSQKSLTSMQYLSSSSGERINNINCDNLRNGMRAICPATVSVIIKLVSKWECGSEIRIAALKCCTLMMIVLQRSSPEERQIELVTIIQLYCDAIIDLLKTEHFCKTYSAENFEISSDLQEPAIDVGALSATIDTVQGFISEPNSCYNICNALLETNIIDILVSIPNDVKNWTIDHQSLSFCVISVFCTITRISKKVVGMLKSTERMKKLFDGIKATGKPSEKLLKTCLNLAFDDDTAKIIVPEVITKLVEWLPEINAKEQNYLSDAILRGCARNYLCKAITCEQRLIKVIHVCLSDFSKLSQTCIQNLIKLIEELAKHSITPIELKHILWLLRDQTVFPQLKQLFQSLVTVALNNLNSGTICCEYLNIQNEEDGIIVPDIKNWTVSGSYGFIFHILLRMDKQNGSTSEDGTAKNQRRMLFTLTTHHDTGFEIFITQNGTLVVGALTKREYLTSSVLSKTLLDGRWHFITVSLTPPKRPFSYSQINVYIDFLQKMSATLKVQAFNEPFSYCTIGSSFQFTKVPELSPSEKIAFSTSHESSSKGMLPSLIERTFFPQIVSHVPNYFTLPLRNTASFDPNVKNFPIGMQDSVFGEQMCLKGQVGAVLLAEPITHLKTIFDGGANFASIFSQDNETLEMTSKFVFCYSAAACSDGVCIDLVPGGRFNGSVLAQHCKTVRIQETINSIGGVQAILPILENFTKNKEEFDLTTNETDKSDSDECVKTPNMEEFSDWEVLSSSSYAGKNILSHHQRDNLTSILEWKMIQHPVAGFICFLRYLTHDHAKNQENLLSTDCLPIIGSMLSKCNPKTFDVHSLMATHLFIESMQNQKPTANMDLLEILYNEIVFNFNIWSRLQFQITLGHVQYLSTMIKDDRKYFRKKFGIQFFLDTIRQYYAIPENITFEDAKTIRNTILGIIRYYIQKEVNIKEVGQIITFMASVKHEHIIVELVDMLINYLEGKNCKDQMYLLLHEPQTADLLYNFFVDKLYSAKEQDAVSSLIDCLLKTSRVNQKHKLVLRLQYPALECQTLYPGFISHIVPLELSSTTISFLIDQILLQEIDYSGLLFLVHHMSLSDISLKLEVSKKLLTTTFTKHGSPVLIAKQVGWQESLARLLIRKPIAHVKSEESQPNSFGINLNDVFLEDNTEFINQSDLITFVENSMELEAAQSEIKDSHLILNEIQASVTEAANVIETEIKELAGSVSGAVAQNFSNVYSVIRQRTSEIQDTFESLALGASIDLETVSSRNRTSSNSSDEVSSIQSTPHILKRQDTDAISVFDFAQDIDVDIEEQLVYLVTNILFTVLWRGVGNDSPNAWKEKGQVLACINLLGLNNELIASHLTLRLRLLEMGVQASLIDLSENGSQVLYNQENASQVLRMVYDLIVLDPNEDDSKKCSTKLLDGVLALLDALMVFQQASQDDWSDMIRLCLGLLLKCSHNPNPSIVAMATAKLHAILQNRNSQDSSEMAYLLYSINKALATAIDVGHSEQYSFLMPVMKALLEKCRNLFSLATNVPDLPPTSSGPVFFNDFQMYSTSKQWRTFIDKKIKPLHDGYQNEIAATLWEPLNTFWAECFEACKAASQKRVTLQMESRRRFQQKIIMPWRVRQVEEMSRLNSASLQMRTKENLINRKWKSAKRFLYGPRGPWYRG